MSTESPPTEPGSVEAPGSHALPRSSQKRRSRLFARGERQGTSQSANSKNDNDKLEVFWSLSAPELLERMGASAEGLAETEARRRLVAHGANVLKPKRRSDAPALLLNQFKSPIVLILLVAVLISLFLKHR